MKIKKNGEVINLTESDLKRILEHSNRIDEGLGRRIKSTFKGIGGMFKGTGYSYTKYAYQLTGTIKELNEDLKETMEELERIIDKSNNSKMSNESFERLSTHITDALGTYQMIIDSNELIIQALDESVSSERNN